MNTFRINSGSFATKEGQQGNYTASTALGKYIHVPKRLMQNLGWTADAPPTDEDYPFYVIAEEKEITKLDNNRQPMVDENGNPITSIRLTATAVFKQKDDIIDAVTEEATLGAEIKQSIAKSASSKGLSQSVVDSLVSAF